MTFNQAIGKMMHEVESGSKEPFIIFRNADGGWHCDTIVNQYGDKYDWVDDIQDPFALTFTSADFDGGSFPYVYDKILTERLRAEYESAPFHDADIDELKALMNLLEENIGELSSEATEYLTLYDRPLAALYDMTPISLKSDDPDFDYDSDKVGVFIEAVEAEVHDKLHNRKKQEIPKELETSQEQLEESNKRKIHGYEEKFSIQLAGKHVVFAENPNDESLYLVCYVQSNNPLGLEECYNDEVFADYVEAMRGFTDRLDGLVEQLETDRSAIGLAVNPLTAAACMSGGESIDWENQLVIVKADILSPEYRSAEHQLAICIGGFGSKSGAMGKAVYVEELYSGKQCRYNRYQIEGVADLDKLPQWAVSKFAEYRRVQEALKEPSVFKFGGYHFKPYRKYDKSEMSKDKTVSDNTLRRMSSDFGLAISAYEWKKDGVDSMSLR